MPCHFTCFQFAVRRGKSSKSYGQLELYTDLPASSCQKHQVAFELSLALVSLPYRPIWFYQILSWLNFDTSSEKILSNWLEIDQWLQKSLWPDRVWLAKTNPNIISWFLKLDRLKLKENLRHKDCSTRQGPITLQWFHFIVYAFCSPWTPNCYIKQFPFTSAQLLNMHGKEYFTSNIVLLTSEIIP